MTRDFPIIITVIHPPGRTAVRSCCRMRARGFAVSTRRRLTVLAVIVAVGAVLRVWGLRFGLPHDLARPDEEKIAVAVLSILHGDFNPHFFLYPSLFIYLTAVAYAGLAGLERALGLTPAVVSLAARAVIDPSRLHLVARGVAAASGVATIVVLYAAASELFSRRAASVASALLAVAFLHVRDSHFGVTDVPVTLLTVWAFWAAARIATAGVTLSRSAVAGLLCGLAASTKYNAVLIALPAVIAIGSGVREPERRAPGTRSLAATVLLAVCLATGFLVGTPFAVLDHRAFLADVNAQRLILSGEGHGGSIIDPARDVYGGVRGWRHQLTFSLRYGLGLPLLMAGMVGACWLLIEDPRRAALLLSFPVAYYAAIGLSLLVYARWTVPLVPFFCLTAGVLIDRLATIAGTLTHDRRAPALCAAALVIAVGAPAAAQSVAFDRLMTKTDTRVLAAQWIEAQFPVGATLYQSGMFYGYVQPHPAERFPQRTFTQWPGFAADLQGRRDLPDVVIVLDSPLVIFSQVPAQIWRTLDTRYIHVATFRGMEPADRSDVYDQQDAFYVAFANLTGARRPGPTVRIFERRPHA
jgi:4-amino-4-deoxy-L-arabinose transferase-like glycosyltransferase